MQEVKIGIFNGWRDLLGEEMYGVLLRKPDTVVLNLVMSAKLRLTIFTTTL